MAGDAHVELPPRERPLLLPNNRKLRHLQGITIRNLTVPQTPPRSRRQTIDDDIDPSALKSPLKTLALREGRKIDHPRPSNDLKPIGETTEADEGVEGSRTSLSPDVIDTSAPSDGSPRPTRFRLRRRSTLEWSGASPLERQRKLEDVTAGRMADTFFSLHVDGVDEPVYISEEIEKVMNPNFRFFDLHAWGPVVTRLDTLTVKVWAKTERDQEYQFLVELIASLGDLTFIGKSLETYGRPFPQNSVLFHLTDGIYGVPATSTNNDDYDVSTDFYASSPKKTDSPSPKSPPSRINTLATSTYDSLMRLSTLDACIQDALTTRHRLTTEINNLLERNAAPISLIKEVPEARLSAKEVADAVKVQRSRVAATKKRRADLASTIAARRNFMAATRASEAEARSEMAKGKEEIAATEQKIKAAADDTSAHRRRVCEDLATIYPILPAPGGKPLAFTIRGLPLPNSVFENLAAKDEREISAALGFVAQLVAQLSLYLAVPLPYPLAPRGSTSTVEDPISLLPSPSSGAHPTPIPSSSASRLRTYPLHLGQGTGAIKYRFEYGVFLLNKDIEILAHRGLGLRVLDVRHTLPNLKYLLYVATAGRGEVPRRRVGGVKALGRGKGGGLEVAEGEDGGGEVEGDGDTGIVGNGHLRTESFGRGRKKVGG